MKAPVDINAVARDAILRAGLDGGAPIVMRTSLFDPLPRVEGSRDQLVRALSNLLVHARESLDGVDGGAIEIETEPDRDRVAVRILDNGPGLSEGQLEQIFDPFAAERESDGEPRGEARKDARGLCDASAILRDHRGTLSVRSRPGEGTCFVALLPVRRG